MTATAIEAALKQYDDALLAERVASLLDLETSLAWLAKASESAVDTNGADEQRVVLESATRRFRRKMSEVAGAYQSAVFDEMKWDAIDELLGTEGTRELFHFFQHPGREGIEQFGMHIVKDSIAEIVGGPLAETLVELWSDGFFESFHDGATWGLSVLTNGQAGDFNLKDPNILKAINDRIAFRAQHFGDVLGNSITNWLRQGLFEEGAHPFDMRRRLKREWPQIAGWQFDRIARTESLIGVSSGAFETFKRNGVEFIEWQAHLDERTRKSHRALDGYEVKIGDRFPNGLRYPGDPEGAVRDIINCRCVMAPVNPDLVNPDRLWTGGATPSGFAAPHGDHIDGLYDYTFKNGGATWDPRRHEYRSKGFAVADKEGTFAIVDVADRAAFRREIERLQREFPDSMVGTWVNDGKVYIDPSHVFGDRTDAVRLAIERNQLALFDLGSKEEINLTRIVPRLSDAEQEALFGNNLKIRDWYRQHQWISADEGIPPNQLKAQVVDDLSSRVAGQDGFDNEKTHTRAINGELVDYTQAKEKVNTMLADWTKTTYHDAPAAGTQRAADLQFGLNSTRPYGGQSWTDADLNNSLTSSGSVSLEDRQALLKAQYDATQKALDATGVNGYVTLYRGMTLPKSQQPASLLGMKVGDVTTTQLEQNPLSSWTTDPNIAEMFGSPGMTSKYSDNDGFVLKAVVPRDRIVSTAVTGMGAASESEALVLDTPGETEVLKAWDGKSMDIYDAHDPAVDTFWRQ